MLVTARFVLKGEWLLGDIDHFARGISVAYAYFYWLIQPVPHIPETIRKRFATELRGREFTNETFPHFLHSKVPTEDRAKILRMKFSTDGWIELSCVSEAMAAVEFVIGAWVSNHSKAGEMVEKIKENLRAFNHIGVEQRAALDQDTGDALKQAERLFNEAAPALGLTRKESIKILALTGNPISALRMLVTLSKACQRLASIKRSGRLDLPELAAHTVDGKR
jgi:hypothetical protein